MEGANGNRPSPTNNFEDNEMNDQLKNEPSTEWMEGFEAAARQDAYKLFSPYPHASKESDDWIQGYDARMEILYPSDV